MTSFPQRRLSITLLFTILYIFQVTYYLSTAYILPINSLFNTYSVNTWALNQSFPWVFFSDVHILSRNSNFNRRAAEQRHVFSGNTRGTASFKHHNKILHCWTAIVNRLRARLEHIRIFVYDARCNTMSGESDPINLVENIQMLSHKRETI
jgi:hypothetical protein